MRDGRSLWIGLALTACFLVVTAPPVMLFWSAIQPEPWNSNTVKIRYQSVRYEAGGLVFRYHVQNLTHHAAHFYPETTQIRALQPSDRPPVGYANVRLPLEIAAASSQLVDIRLELPATRLSLSTDYSDEQTKMVLQHKPPGSAPDNDSPVSPLPMRGKIARNESQAVAPAFSFEDSLTDLQGFELTVSNKDVRLVFPRGW